jgi:tripartite-type tricarboxylate transporter receptor subunit TctC
VIQMTQVRSLELRVPEIFKGASAASTCYDSGKFSPDSPAQVEAGKLKAFAVAQPKRASIMPDVPTLAEAGMTGYDAGIWIGLLAPAGTAPAIIEKLSAAANGALNTEAVRSGLKQQGTDPVGGTPAEFADFIRTDIEKWVALLAAPSATK